MNAFSERTGRLVALLLIAGSGVVTIAKGMSLTFLAIRLQRDFGLTPAGIGVLIGAGPLLGAIISPFAGSLSDRIGRTGVLTIALFMPDWRWRGSGWRTRSPPSRWRISSLRLPPPSMNRFRAH